MGHDFSAGAPPPKTGVIYHLGSSRSRGRRSLHPGSPHPACALLSPHTGSPRPALALLSPHPDLHAPHLPSSLRTPYSPPHHLRTQTSTPLLPRPTSALVPRRQPRARPHLCLVRPQPQPTLNSLGLWEAESFRGQAAKVRKVQGTGGLREGLRARPLPPYLFRAVGPTRNCKPLDTCQ